MTTMESSKNPDYQDGVNYWATQDASVTGVMGGFGEETVIPRLDAISNRMLLLKIMPELGTIVPVNWQDKSESPRIKAGGSSRVFSALDCGAGIGRVTESALLPLFDRVDLVEPVEKFVEQLKAEAQDRVKGWHILDSEKAKAIRVYKKGLQHFDFDEQTTPFYETGNKQLLEQAGSDPTYDVIWIQWCIGHLSDEDTVKFLKTSKKFLKTSTPSYIFVKENIATGSENGGVDYVFDEQDSSNTRSDKVFRRLFEEAGLQLVRVEKQQGFPPELFQVNTYVLK